MSDTRTRTSLMKRVVDEAGQCELCGSKRSLEAHHIIPVVYGGKDTEDNLICVCRKCHAILTPKGLLTKKGIENTKDRNDVMQCVYFVIRHVYMKADENLRKYGSGLHSDFVFDALEDVKKTAAEQFLAFKANGYKEVAE